MLLEVVACARVVDAGNPNLPPARFQAPDCQILALYLLSNEDLKATLVRSESPTLSGDLTTVTERLDEGFTKL